MRTSFPTQSSHFLVILTLYLLLFGCNYWYSTRFEDSSGEKLDKEILKGKTILLAATRFFGEPIGNSVLRKCLPVIQERCHVTSDMSLLPNASAVVFHSRDFDESTRHRFGAWRNATIPFVLMSLESPSHAGLHDYRHFFNWTMSYRRDSDVFHPYGRLAKRRESEKVDYEKLWVSKRKEALWLVSNTRATGNRRRELVERMVERGMRVDLLGSLFGRQPSGCSRSASSPECELQLHTPYKFYVSFENSNCNDYVTEKFWKKANRFQMVPIVMSRSIYRALEVTEDVPNWQKTFPMFQIPDSMYISIDDFSNLDEFVAHIKSVSANKTAYLGYHTWRDDFRILDANEETIGFCDLCRKMIDSEGIQEKKKKSYENVKTWHSESQCDNSLANRYL